VERRGGPETSSRLGYRIQFDYAKSSFQARRFNPCLAVAKCCSTRLTRGRLLSGLYTLVLTEVISVVPFNLEIVKNHSAQKREKHKLSGFDFSYTSVFPLKQYSEVNEGNLNNHNN